MICYFDNEFLMSKRYYGVSEIPIQVWESSKAISRETQKCHHWQLININVESNSKTNILVSFAKPYCFYCVCHFYTIGKQKLLDRFLVNWQKIKIGAILTSAQSIRAHNNNNFVFQTFLLLRMKKIYLL